MKILYILLSFVYILSIEIEFNDKIQDFIEYTKKYNKEYRKRGQYNSITNMGYCRNRKI